MTVTWTSGYDMNEAIPFVEWGLKGGQRTLSPAGTLTFSQNDMCGKVYFLSVHKHKLVGFLFVQELKSEKFAVCVSIRLVSEVMSCYNDFLLNQ